MTTSFTQNINLSLFMRAVRLASIIGFLTNSLLGCEKPNECTINSECGTKYLCREGVCRPKCLTYLTCEEGEACVDGACEIPTADYCSHIVPTQIPPDMTAYEPCPPSSVDETLGGAEANIGGMDAMSGGETAITGGTEITVITEDTAGEDTAGEDTAGEDTAGEDTAGADTAGEDTAGADMAGEVTAGADMAGEVTAGEAAGEAMEAGSDAGTEIEIVGGENTAGDMNE